MSWLAFFDQHASGFFVGKQKRLSNTNHHSPGTSRLPLYACGTSAVYAIIYRLVAVACCRSMTCCEYLRVGRHCLPVVLQAVTPVHHNNNNYYYLLRPQGLTYQPTNNILFGDDAYPSYSTRAHIIHRPKRARTRQTQNKNWHQGGEGTTSHSPSRVYNQCVCLQSIWRSETKILLIRVHTENFIYILVRTVKYQPYLHIKHVLDYLTGRRRDAGRR